ncbi:MAG: efflux RND transporter periplasmic adaptor subunit [Candidatus Thiodiazotropha sp. (ex Epidulcina cf. delphinae)]|nr:efflux RND transporter periplasmic adaptor subunit [Candidatus Thiodiazotropha sp. (ex Epidulcina cf. delphinae)]
MKIRLLLLLFFWQVAHAESTLTLSAQERAAFDIATAPVQAVRESLSKSYPAKVGVPNAKLRVVSAPLDGVVEALLVAEGESVKKDQPLVTIRSRRLLALQAAYLESRTRRQLSGETLARDRKLHAEGIVAKRRLLESRAAHREARTAEERDHQTLALAGMPAGAIKALDQQQKLSAVLQVKSPLDGVVLEQIATAGQRLAASDPLYRVGDLSTLWIEVHVPVNALEGITEGSPVILASGLRARVITIGRMVHGTDQGVLIRAEVKEGAEKLRPGQFVEARMSQSTGGGQLRLPSQAVLRIDGRDQVFAERAGDFEPVPVEVVSREAGTVVVRTALNAGDPVVVSGTAALKAALAEQE